MSAIFSINGWHQLSLKLGRILDETSARRNPFKVP
jgi:hypothetical protein